jgi:hypothetical protein
MNKKLFKICLVAGFVALAGCDKAEQPAMEKATAEKPSASEEIVVTMEATVTAINQETREVTLKNAAGESVTFIADDKVRNLAQVEVGDTLSVEYMEGVMIEVVDPATELGTSTADAAGRAKQGEKPGGVAISETSVVVVIEAIDLENETATVKTAEDKSKIVKARNPENLKKVVVGDKVMITFTQGIAITVTEK